MKTENNVLLAEFIQLEKMHCSSLKTTYYKMHEIVGNPHSLKKWYEPNQLQFHENIDWLEPVIDKVKEIVPDTTELEKYLALEDKNLIFQFCVNAIKNNSN